MTPPAAQPPDPAALNDQVLALVGELLATGLEPRDVERITDELVARREALGDVLTLGVNPPRTDYGDAWEHARASAYAPTENVGAVHLELGSWTAFPSDRVRTLIEGDGLAEFIRLDSDPQYEAEVVADATSLPFRSSVIDRVASNSTLEHVSRPDRVIEEAYRVLRPGGVFVTATPFVWHEHGYPDDYQRPARGFYERILTEAGFTDIAVDRDGSSGLYYTLHNAMKMAEFDEALPEHAAMAELHRLVVVLLGTLIPLDRYFTHGARYWYHSVRVVARKPGTYEPSRRERAAKQPFHERAVDLLADPSTKQPLVARGRELISETSGVRFATTPSGGVNFMEPRYSARGPRSLAKATIAGLRTRRAES